MAGRPKAPYRPPCYGWPATPRVFVNCNTFRPPSPLPKRWANITTVPDYADPPGDPIPPYPRNFQYCLGTTAGYVTSGPGDPLVGPWLDEDFPGCTPAEGVDSVAGNCYSLTEDDATFPDCAAGYFKAVQATKIWHGRFGFMSHDDATGQSPITNYEVLGPECLNCQFEAYQGTPDGTKYCTESLSISHHNLSVAHNTGGSTFTIQYEQTYSHSRSVSVDPGSGYPTVSCSESKLIDYDLSDAGTPVQHCTSTDFETWTCDSGEMGPETHCCSILTNDYLAALKAVNAQGGRIHWPDASPPYHLGFYTPAELVARFESDFPGADITVELSGTRLHVNITEEILPPEGADPDTDSYCECNAEFDLVLELGGEYTADDLVAEVNSLAAHWDLADEAVYPWRSDNFLTVAPLVSRKEYQAAQSPHIVLTECTVYDGTPLGPGETEADHQQPWIFQGYTEGVANPNPWTGEVLGAPNPAGYDGHFDYLHRSRVRCGGTAITTYFGAKSAENLAFDGTDSAMPRSATQWTENITDWLRYPGPFAAYGSGRYLLQKWAECRVKHNSMNFARPCGLDRFAIDETRYRCIASSAGDPVVTVTLYGSSDVTTGTHCVAYGKVWSVTRVSDTEFELTTELATVPAEVVLDPDAFAPVRFPSAPAICGRVAVASADQSGGSVEIALAADAYLRPGDSIDFTGVAGLGTATVATVINERSFTVAGTLAGAYGGGGYAASTGAAAYYWNDDQSKGEFLWLTWQHNFRDYQEVERVLSQYETCDSCGAADPGAVTPLRVNQSAHGMPQSVSAFTATAKCFEFACRSVFVCSPNPEGFVPSASLTVESVTLPDLTPDERYGALWQGQVVQTMQDPFWQQPHNPCAGGAAEDDGRCHSVEARGDTLPDDGGPGQDETSPALAAGVELHILTLAELDTAGDVTGVVYAPPPGDTDSGQYGSAWSDPDCL